MAFAIVRTESPVASKEAVNSLRRGSAKATVPVATPSGIAGMVVYGVEEVNHHLGRG
jgi:hypothetical protein